MMVIERLAAAEIQLRLLPPWSPRPQRPATAENTRVVHGQLKRSKKVACGVSEKVQSPAIRLKMGSRGERKPRRRRAPSSVSLHRLVGSSILRPFQKQVGTICEKQQANP